MSDRQRVSRAKRVSGHLPLRLFPAMKRLHAAGARPPARGRPTHAVAEIFADKQTQRWLPLPATFGQIDGLPWCTEMAQERRDSGSGDHYGVIRREDDRLVGCLWTKRTDWVGRGHRDLYAWRADARGFGVAAEAVDALAIALILEHGFQRIELRVAPGNTGLAPGRREGRLHLRGAAAQRRARAQWPGGPRGLVVRRAPTSALTAKAPRQARGLRDAAQPTIASDGGVNRRTGVPLQRVAQGLRHRLDRLARSGRRRRR